MRDQYKTEDIRQKQDIKYLDLKNFVHALIGMYQAIKRVLRYPLQILGIAIASAYPSKGR
jgi:hypothetical protein